MKNREASAGIIERKRDQCIQPERQDGVTNDQCHIQMAFRQKYADDRQPVGFILAIGC